MRPAVMAPFSAGRIPIITLMVGLAAMVVWWFPSLNEVLQYDRNAIGQGQLSRLLTCHLIHWSSDHLVWNLIAFLILGWLSESVDRRKYAICLIGSAAVITGAVWFLLPSLTSYRGLSGLDSVLFVFLGSETIRRHCQEQNRIGIVLGVVILFLFLVKISFEQITGTALFARTEDLYSPVPLAHVIGAIWGLAAGFIISGKSYPNPNHQLILMEKSL